MMRTSQVCTLVQVQMLHIKVNLQEAMSRSYNKRSTRYFVRFIFILMRIIYYLSVCTLIVLRYIEEEKAESDHEDRLANRITRVKNGPVQVLDRLAKTDQCKEIFITFYS